MSAATADRLLHGPRMHGQRGLATTRTGTLLKQQIAIRTFEQWNETQPGFLEVDVVAHCGSHLDGSFLSTLTLTDIATGWTECMPLRTKSAEAVVSVLQQARTFFPFPILGVDTDNGCEFINERLLAYCDAQQITFTRGREGVKNDQNFVEQKNGAVVRQVVGYDRFEGEHTYQQLGELYQALRLFHHLQELQQALLCFRASVSSGVEGVSMKTMLPFCIERCLGKAGPAASQREEGEEQKQAVPVFAPDLLPSCQPGQDTKNTTPSLGQEMCSAQIAPFQHQEDIAHLRVLETDLVVQRLIQALKDGDSEVRSVAVQTLKTLEEWISENDLLLLFEDPDWSVRRIVERVPLDRLLPLLKDPDWHVRGEVARALGTLGERVPLDRLLPLLEDSEPFVRKKVVGVLGTLVLAKLTELLDWPQWQVRVKAAQALGSIRRNIPETAIQRLLEMRRNPDPTMSVLREAADDALAEILSLESGIEDD